MQYIMYNMIYIYIIYLICKIKYVVFNTENILNNINHKYIYYELDIVLLCFIRPFFASINIWYYQEMQSWSAISLGFFPRTKPTGVSFGMLRGVPSLPTRTSIDAGWRAEAWSSCDWDQNLTCLDFTDSLFWYLIYIMINFRYR